MSLELMSRVRSFNGWQSRYQHQAQSTHSKMTFSIYQPDSKTPTPVVYWLSGLSCTDENFSVKSGAQRIAAMLGITLVIPDTSPRGDGVADDPNYDLGQGAGFYLNATRAPWCEHYQMFDYISDELPRLVEQAFFVNEQRAISGHSMGGHGALMMGLRLPKRYSSISAVSPICQPSSGPWGQKAFHAYLGDDKASWQAYDSCELLTKADTLLPTKISVGEQDEFLLEQLKPEAFLAIASQRGLAVDYQAYQHFDHSYYFVATVIEVHLRFHQQHFTA